jgi:mannose-6-phosphate isomerase
LTTFDTIFSAPHGGYAETAAGGTPRRQNPHMHLFEAMLSLFELTGEPHFLARAGQLFGLWRTRWFDDAGGSLREFFAADWSLLPDGGSEVFEPGHHMEWVWLLRRYERLSGRSVTILADALFARGEALGLKPSSAGFIVDETDGEGSPRQDSRRLWSQTEYLKALIVQARAHGDDALYERARTLSDRLFATYLAGVPAGGWRDRFSIEGELKVDHIPASTLYHLFGVLAELAVPAGGAATAVTRTARDAPAAGDAVRGE